MPAPVVVPVVVPVDGGDGSVVEAMVGAVAALAAAGIGALATLWARRPTRSRPELVDAVILDPAEPLDAPVLDLALRNRSGETAVVTRVELDVLWARTFAVLDELLPRPDTSGAAMMAVSATYDVTLPEPAADAGARVSQHVAHVLRAGDADRLHMRLNAPTVRAHQVRAALPTHVTVYLLRPRVLYNADARSIESRPLAAACPGNTLYVPTPQQLRQQIDRFETEVDLLRQRIDREMAAAGMAAPDWSGRPPRRADLPAQLPVFGADRPPGDSFWQPQQAITRHLDDAETICRDIVAALSDRALRGRELDGLESYLPLAQHTLDQMPALRAELRTTRLAADGGRADPSGATGAS